MKVKALLAIAAALTLIFVIGCSNSSRTTAPVENETFDLSGSSDNGAVRFEGENETPITQGSNPRIVIIYGKYSKDFTGCLSVETAWKEFTELTFQTGPPAAIPSGAYVQVRGEYLSIPGTRCSFEKHLKVTSIKMIDPSL